MIKPMRDEGVKLDIFLIEMSQPVAQKMQDEEKIEQRPGCCRRPAQPKKKRASCACRISLVRQGAAEKFEQGSIWRLQSHFVKQENDCARGETSYLSSPEPARKCFMADVANKYSENVEGKFYVDDQCIDCDLCRETAPANFKRNDDGGHSFVYKQPESPEEETLCKEAMEGCPVEAIGSDGG